MEESQLDIEVGDDRSLQTAESLRVLREEAGQALDEHRQRVGEVESRLNEQLELIAEELAREQSTDSQSLAEKEAEVEEVLDQLAMQSLEFEALLAERDVELEQVLELGEEEFQQREVLEQELAAVQQTLEDLRSQESTDGDETRAELTAMEQQRKQLDEQYSTLQEEHATQQTELDEACQAMEASRQHAAELREQQQDSQQNSEQLEQTQRKFDLALADVHKLKRENAELHEELLSRPEANDQESPELVSLRVERDALAERISELENAPAPLTSADEQQELEDLQRRFELAVDDVRQFKQENTDLRERLEATPAATTASAKDEPLDWQAQKALLMAVLEAEDQDAAFDEIDEPRREERATLEGTISITDRVVAEKDAMLAKWEAEVADLQSQLKARPEGQDVDALRDKIAAEILGDDEAVQTEVARLHQQQEQLDGKLRKAELEISVQRATLAREQMALEEKLAKLPAEDSEGEESSPGKPRRRWLAALGLKDDGES